MREPLLKVILAAEIAFCATIGFATMCAAQVSENMEKCVAPSGDFSILLPKPVIDKNETDISSIYISKANNIAYVVTIVKRNERWKETTDEAALADFIRGHQSEYTVDEKKDGKKVDIKLIEDLKGDGWFGKLYSFVSGKIPGYWKYAVSKHWVYVITAFNDANMTEQTKKVFESLVVSDAGKDSGVKPKSEEVAAEEVKK